MRNNTEWANAQQWEQGWWGNCIGVEFSEQVKQIVYAEKMGLRFVANNKTPYTIPLTGSVADIGGGPCSLLLKAKGKEQKVVVDPLEFPMWVYERYKTH